MTATSVQRCWGGPQRLQKSVLKQHKGKAVLKLVLAVLFVFGLVSTVLAADEKVNGKAVETFEWDELMPADFSPEKIFAITEQFGSLDDFDPKAQQALDELMFSLKAAPTRKDLAGKMIKLPGFVVPLEGDGDKVTSFFLVPYFGACIHVPPPPANQMVYVEYEPGVKVDNLYDAIWVTGELGVTMTENELGTAGYTMDGFRIEPYEEF